MSETRCRFAPSPTGFLHLGGARTALFNYLYARNSGGKFLLRIEDTDLERSTPEAVEQILKSLEWLGLRPDETEVYQTKNRRKHLEIAKKLLESGAAYPCYATADELAQMREEALQAKRKRLYNDRYRPASASPSNLNLPTSEDKKPFVIRFRVKREDTTTFNDSILKSISTPNEEIDDFVIVRSDGSPTYNLACTVDDYMMGITDVIRGLDHVSNTPKQVLIYQAMQWKVPNFAHLPMILGQDKKKLSKRHGAASVMEYKELGFLPEAFLNYLARLGWSHGDQEVFSLQELEKLFSLDSVSKSAAVFDPEKAIWTNSEHLKKLSEAELERLLIPYLENLASFSKERLSGNSISQLILLGRERSKTLLELAKNMEWFFENPKEISLDKSVVEKIGLETVQKALLSFKTKLEDLDAFDESSLDSLIKEVVSENNLKFPHLGKPLRMALTGNPTGPSIPAVMLILGKESSNERVSNFISRLSD